MDNARPRSGAPKKSSSMRPYALLVGAFVLVAGATVVFASRGDAPADTATASADGTTPATPAAGQPAPAVDPATAPGCTFDTTVPPVRDLDRVIGGAPAMGEANAPVTVVEIFDPNCPHCKDLYEALHGTGFVEERAQQARFYYVPFPLWDFSLGQVSALRLSREEGRYTQLIQELFNRQGGRGMTLDQVVDAAEAAGMNPTELRRKLTDNATLDPLLQNILDHRQAVIDAITVDGQMSVPKVLINGRLLAATVEAYTPECIGRLIDEAAAAPAAN